MKIVLLLVMKLEKLNALVQQMDIMIIFYMTVDLINAGSFLILILKDMNLGYCI